MRSRAIFLIARLIPSVLGFVVAAVLTRLLEPVEYGLYALGLSIIFFITIGIFEWLSLSMLRMAPAAKQPDLFFGTVMTCFGALYGFCLILFGLVLILGGVGSYNLLMVAALVASFASVAIELKQRLQMAELREADYFRMSVGRGVITSILVCVTTYVWHNACANLFALGVGIFLASLLVREPRLSFRKCRFDSEVFRSLLHFGFPLSVSVGLGTILMSVDRWLLQVLSGPQAVGLFTAATLVAQMPILALANGIGPSAYSMAVQALEFRSRDKANAQLAQNFVILFGIVVPSALGINALSANVGNLLVGHFYLGSVISLAPWLSASAVVGTIRGFYVDTAFQLANRTLSLIWLTVLAVVVNIAIDVWLIPTKGELGAAIGSFCALLVSFVVAVVLSRRVFVLPMPFVDSAKILVSAGLMFLVLRELAWWSGTLALACQISLGSLVYVVLIIALNVLNTRDLIVQRSPQLWRWLLLTR